MECMRIIPLMLNLQLFADGGGTGGNGTGAEGATGATETAAVSQKGVKANPLANVKYGIQAEEAPAQAADVQNVKTTDGDGNTTQTVDRKAEFDKLIKGEYKDLYDSSVQNILSKRLANQKAEAESQRATVEKYEALSPILEMLAKKYGISDASDIKALNKAIEDDNSYYEEEAMQKGISVEHLKEIKKMERENATLKKQMQEQSVRENAEKLYAKWMQQAEGVKAVYPSFDLRTEMQNPKFVDLLKVPSVDVRTAYEVMHKDEIIPAAMQFTAKTVEKKLTDKMIANGARPTENGISSQSASVVKSDVSKLSSADIDEVIRRVARGEKISFG